MRILDTAKRDGFDLKRVEYIVSDGDLVPAYLFEPHCPGPCPGVAVYHQHGSEWHLGKSEVAGIEGSAWQAFGPELARRGMVVIAPDAIAFEDRRHNVTGTEPHEDDWLQHYNQLAYRLLQGDTLMRKVLSDAADALSVLVAHERVDDQRVGVLGHSFGGNTVLFHAAVDDRVRFAAASGAACSFRTKIEQRTGIEMSEVIPGFLTRFDIEDLVKAMAPRPVLLVSGTEDKYSLDAPAIVGAAAETFRSHGVESALRNLHYPGGHELGQVRFDAIVEWTVVAAGTTTR